MIGWPFRYSVAGPTARRTAPAAPASMTAWLGRIPLPSSTRSQDPLPMRI